ncbi:MAG: S8 family serine peptidase, partial [Sulfolobales archaeon]
MSQIKKIIYISTLFLILIISLSPIQLLRSSEETTSQLIRTAYVSPILYNESYWKYGGYVEDENLLANMSVNKPVKLLNSRDVGRVIILADYSVNNRDVAKSVKALLSVYPLYDKKVFVATITRDQIDKLASMPGIIAVLPDIRLDSFYIKERRLLNELESATGQVSPLQTSSQISGGAYHYTVNITRAIDVWYRYGIKGENAKIAIVDTGVDYGSPALGVKAIARDQYGWPLILDADSYGLVLTPVEGNVSGNTLYINTSLLYVFDSWFPAVYREEVGVVWTGCGYDEFDISQWDISNIKYYGKIKFGLAVKNIIYPYGLLWYTLPVILVDSNGDGYYDTLYAATSIVLYYIAKQLSSCGVYIPNAPTEPRYIFDSGPIRYGNEVIAKDLNGDGITDVSFGTLAGYIYDATWAIIREKLGIWKQYVQPLLPWDGYYSFPEAFEVWWGEPISVIWPGLDPMGDYVVLVEDFYSHGTFCATTAAGRDFYAQTGYGDRSLSGQAPSAQIASSVALWFGDVFTSIYFFSGFDLQTPYGIGSRFLWPVLLNNPWILFYGYSWNWTYTGAPLVDMTSNSYGVSAWAIWGWASGMDPLSAVFDYTSLISGVAHFVAAGNGGPGWGTVTTPGAGSFVITVGAGTEFTYRPIYGYLPGGNRELITWSNRGPSEVGVVKPDVVAIGSFAWAVGRTWESLSYRTIDGRYAYDLFGGTSQATPMSAGVGALVVSAYKSKYGSGMPAYLLKTVLMNSAYDMGFNELSQGAGFVDAYRAVSMIMDPSILKIYSREFVNDVLSDMNTSYTAFTYGGSVSMPQWYEPKIYVPEIFPGGSTIKTLEISGSGSLRLYSVKMIQISSQSICSLSLVATPDLVVNCTGDTLYLNMTGRRIGLATLIIDPSKLPKDQYFEIEIVYPFSYFNKGGRWITWDTYVSLAELWYWIDLNNDGLVQLSETARITYDIRGANALRIQVAKLSEQIREIEYLVKTFYGVDTTSARKAVILRIGLYYSWINDVVPIKIRLNTYGYTTWGDVYVSPSTLSVSGSAKVYVVIRAPNQPGFYSGYIVAEDLSRGYRYLIPVSYFVPVI